MFKFCPVPYLFFYGEQNGTKGNTGNSLANYLHCKISFSPSIASILSMVLLFVGVCIPDEQRTEGEKAQRPLLSPSLIRAMR
jgi:hypothetical protein